MLRHTFLALLILVFSAATNAAPKPHILYILVDDLGYADVSFNGGEIKTPHIDSIATAGVKLSQFYVQPLCSPTRAALLTGRYPMRYGLQVDVVRDWAEYGLSLDERTLPQALREVGYTTAIVGKWHLGHSRPEYLPTRRGFDHQYGHYNGALNYFTHFRFGGFDWHRDDKVNRDEGYTTHLLAKESIRLIEAQDPAKPLFLYLAFNAPHVPFQVPEHYTKQYEHLEGKRRIYAGMVAAVDEAVGQILAALDRKQMRQNTLIVFHSDNGGGGVSDNGPFRGVKHTLYEGGVRAAACAAWPGRIRPGSTVDQPIHVVDMYPTLLNLAGASLQQKLPLDGLDVWPTIAEGKSSPRTEILLNTTPHDGALRIGDYKLVINGERDSGDEEGNAPAAPGSRRRARKAAQEIVQVELFNLNSDPIEKNNLAEEEPGKVKQLRARYDELSQQAVPPLSAPAAPDFKVPPIWGEATRSE